MITYNLGVCAIQENLIFGWSVYTEHGWMPFDQFCGLASGELIGIISRALQNPVVSDEARAAWELVDIPF